jgi:hypothetical protein
MSAPISTSSMAAPCSSMPGRVCSSLSCGCQGCRPCSRYWSMRAMRCPICSMCCTISWATKRCTALNCSVLRASHSSCLLARSRPLWFSTSCMGCPSIRALTMARALCPWMSATSTLMRMPASTSTLCSRFFSALHMPTRFCRWRATRRSWRICTGGMNEARSKPARASVASHCASAMSVLRPGTALTCRALTTQAIRPTACSAANGLFQYTPVLCITTTSGAISSAHCAKARRSRLKAPKSRLVTSTRPSSCSTTAQAVILAW